MLGGTGAIGGAAALRLAGSGWSVDVTGRDAERMPADLTRAGVRFLPIDRGDTRAIDRLVGDGVDLLVDAVAYSASDLRALLPTMRRASGVVVISSRAVYVDADGHRINGDEPPRFAVPIGESNAVLPAAGDGVDPFSRDGYGPSKAAVEREALGSGLPVTVLRPSKVHGRWARNARTRSVIERMRGSGGGSGGSGRIPVARPGAVDHLTAAANTAALIETVAGRPGARILNTADPDTPAALEVVQRIAELIGWDGVVQALGPDADPDGEGAHPWSAAHPIVLDTSASLALGYRPVGTSLELLADEVDWVVGR